MTHIDNISHLWDFGFTKVGSVNANPNYVPIGDGSLINSRSHFVLPNGRLLGDYIPFYFWYKMPMLYIIQNGYKGVNAVSPSNIVYCVTNIQKIVDLNLEFLFSDGHGVNNFSCFYNSSRVSEINELLDFAAITDAFWNDAVDLDKKRRKEAEFLVSSDIPKEAILGFYVFNQAAKQRLLDLGIPDHRIRVKNVYYF